MANFGDLPRGEIPEPLKYNKPFSKLQFTGTPTFQRIYYNLSFSDLYSLKWN
jgi:hypothetical protein